MVLALALGLPAVVHGGQAAGDEAPEVSARPASAPRSPRVDLTELRRAELAGGLEALWDERPVLALRVLLLRIGREVPATVTAARRTERLEERAEALAWLREQLDSEPEVRAALEAELAVRLDDTTHPALWAATVRSLGRLGEAEHAPHLAAVLEGEDPQRAHAASEALHDLFLRWFESEEQFLAFWPEAQGSCGDSVFMETARQKEREARLALIQLLRYEPARAADLVRSRDPRLRAAAATALGRTEDTTAVEALFQLLEGEPSGETFQAGFEALQGRLSGAGPEAPEVRRLRALLVRRLRAGEVELQAPLADGLRRIAWSDEGLGEDGLFVGIDALVVQLRRLLERDRLTDRDTLAASFGALLGLASRADGLGLEVGPRLVGLEPALLDRVEDPGEAPAVRGAAVQLLPLLRDGATVERLARALEASELPPALGYRLLGAIATLAAGLPPGDPSAQLALDTLLAQLEASDEVLRRRALAELRSPELASVVALAEPAAFVDALAVETEPELQAQLLGLTSSHGGAAEAERLIALPRFDAIATAGPGAQGRLAQTLERLAGEDAALLVRVLERLLAVDDAGTRVLRLRGAIGAVAGLSPAALGALEASEHRAIVRWATEVRAASGSVPGDRAFLERLVDLHLPGCGTTELAGEAARLQHVRALLLSDLTALDGTATEAVAVVGAFAEAERLATAAADAQLRSLVRRDRARFRAARGEPGPALDDYRALFATELAPGAAGPSVLELADLRRGGELLVEAATTAGTEPGAAERLTEALQVSLALAADPDWPLEPVGVRRKDLRDLAARAAGCSDRPLVEQTAQLLAAVPALPEPAAEGDAPEPPVAPEGAVWGDLLGEPEAHAELIGLREGLAARVAALIALEQEAAEEESAGAGPGTAEEAGQPGEPEPAEGIPPPDEEQPEPGPRGDPEQQRTGSATPDGNSPPVRLAPGPVGTHDLPLDRGVEQSGSSSGS